MREGARGKKGMNEEYGLCGKKGKSLRNRSYVGRKGYKEVGYVERELRRKGVSEEWELYMGRGPGAIRNEHHADG